MSALRSTMVLAALGVWASAHRCAPPEGSRTGTARARLSVTLSTGADFTAGTSTGVDVTSIPGALLLSPRADWWDAGWQYRLPIEVDAGGFARLDYPLALPIDGPGLLAFTDAGFDPTSVRIAERGPGGAQELPSFFDQGADAGNGLLMFSLAGSTPQAQGRQYDVYLDTTARGPKGTPAYYDGSPDASIDNGVLAFPRMGQGVSGSPQPMSFAAVDSRNPVVKFIWVRHNRVSYSGTDYAPVLAEEGQPLAANAYQEVDGPRILLATASLQIQRMVVKAGALRLSQYSMLGSGSAARLLIAVENTGPSEVDGGQYFEGVDIDVLGATCFDDLLVWDAANGILHGYDDTTPGHLGIRADVAPSHHAAVVGAVWGELSAEQLDDTADAGPGDVEGALQYAIPPLAPGQRWLLHESWGVSTSSYPPLRDELLNLSDLPVIRAGAVEGMFPPTASWTSSPMDFADPAAQWGTISWTASLPPGAQLGLQTRSGQVPSPDGTWSAWSAPSGTSGSPVTSPPGRYLQLLATFTAEPTVEVAPRVDDVTVTASTVADLPPVSLELSGPPDPVPSWQELGVELVARSPDGGVDPGYAGTVALTSTDPAAALPPAFVFGAADQGRHTFAVTFRTHGPQTLTAREVARPGIAASRTFEVVDQARTLNVGCGCGASSGGAAIWLAAAALWRLRRRTRDPKPPRSSRAARQADSSAARTASAAVAPLSGMGRGAKSLGP